MKNIGRSGRNGEDELVRQERERVEGGLGPVLANMTEADRDEVLKVIRGEPVAR